VSKRRPGCAITIAALATVALVVVGLGEERPTWRARALVTIGDGVFVVDDIPPLSEEAVTVEIDTARLATFPLETNVPAADLTTAEVLAFVRVLGPLVWARHPGVREFTLVWVCRVGDAEGKVI
jgi:hypothetical protein